MLKATGLEKRLPMSFTPLMVIVNDMSDIIEYDKNKTAISMIAVVFRYSHECYISMWEIWFLCKYS